MDGCRLIPAAVHAGAEPDRGAVAWGQKGDCKPPVQDRRRAAKVHTRHAAQGRDKDGKDEQMADVDTTPDHHGRTA